MFDYGCYCDAWPGVFVFNSMEDSGSKSSGKRLKGLNIVKFINVSKGKSSKT